MVLESSIKTFASKVTNSVTRLAKKEEEDEFEVLHSMLSLMNHQLLVSGKLSCQSKLIPTIFFAPQELFFRLDGLNRKLRQQNKTLAISLDNFNSILRFQYVTVS